jgi:uncharacterized protein YtpQ (UPF0354 family)
VGLLDFLRGRRPEDAFAARVMKRLRERSWPHTLQYERESFSIVTGGEKGTLYLGTLFQDWKAYPKRAQAEQLDHIIGMVFEFGGDETFEGVADKLMPVVRNLAHLQALSLGSDVDPSPEVGQTYKVLVDPLGILLAIDRPHSIALVHKSKLDSWGCTFEVALERAINNLVARSPVRFERTEYGFYISDYGDGYDSSRLLMPELFVALQLPGDPIAVAISRTCIAVAGSEDLNALAAMSAFVVETFNNETRPTSWMPMALRDGEWVRFVPEVPERGAVRDLSIRQDIWDYDPQTRILEGYVHRKEENVFVAPLEFVTKQGDAYTWTSWTEDVPAWLPRAEGIGLTNASGLQLFRLRRDVEAVCGSFVADARFHPPRFTPPLWPDADSWKRLEVEFVEPEWWTTARNSP